MTNGIEINVFRNETEIKTFSPGETIYSAGEIGDTMYAVLEGELNVVVNGVVVETIGVGGIVGEMALIDPAPRSASVVAKTEAKLAVVNQKRFTTLVQNTPFFALQVMRIMAQRIRNTNKQVD
jgi:CRP/FNR family transcriptional regulator, cyclic AMP receptor protein